MDLELKNKNVFITGGAKGIGLGIAEAFLAEGAVVMTNSRTEFSHSKISHLIADVTSPEESMKVKEALTSRFTKGLDILVCNVGSGTSVPPGQECYQDWLTSFTKNFLSTTNMIENLVPTLNPGGAIVCISSICGFEQLGAPLTYSASKAALNSYITGISPILARKSIRINGVAPGNIFFPGSVWETKIKENASSVEQMLNEKVSLKRFGKVEEIANTVIFLASIKSSFTTGTVFIVDGGQVKSW